MNFKYLAQDERGRLKSDVIQAKTKADALRTLQAQGLLIFELSSDEASEKQAKKTHSVATVSLRLVHKFTSRLAPLCSKHIPIEHALQILAQTSDEKEVKAYCDHTLKAVRAGKRVSEALEMHDRVFPPHFLAILKAGEQMGDLGHAFAQIAKTAEQSLNFSSKLKTAAIYPGLIFVFAIFAIVTILLWVVPSMKPVFEAGSGPSSPEIALIVFLSDGLKAYGIEILWIGSAVLLTGLVWYKSKVGRKAFDRMVLGLPIIGRMILQVETTRIMGLLSDLLKGGLTLNDSLHQVEKGLSNQSLRDALGAVRIDIRRGQSLSAALDNQALFPSLFGQIAAVGERTGSLSDILADSAVGMRAVIEQKLTRYSALAVPIMTIVTGLIVGAIAIIILSAVLSVNELTVQ